MVQESSNKSPHSPSMWTGSKVARPKGLFELSELSLPVKKAKTDPSTNKPNAPMVKTRASKSSMKKEKTDLPVIDLEYSHPKDILASLTLFIQKVQEYLF